eukprot:scaffold535831_cov16-Prasinocladus_malaysianus.AAC.1
MIGLSSVCYLSRQDIFAERGIEVPGRSREELLHIFEELDSDKSGALSRHEFMALWAALAKARQ